MTRQSPIGLMDRIRFREHPTMGVSCRSPWVCGYSDGSIWAESRPPEDAEIAASLIGPNRLINPSPHKIATSMITSKYGLGVSASFAHHYVFGYHEVCPAYALGFFAGWMNVFAPRV